VKSKKAVAANSINLFCFLTTGKHLKNGKSGFNLFDFSVLFRCKPRRHFWNLRFYPEVKHHDIANRVEYDALLTSPSDSLRTTRCNVIENGNDLQWGKCELADEYVANEMSYFGLGAIHDDICRPVNFAASLIACQWYV